jgi:hypothetical protein
MLPDKCQLCAVSFAFDGRWLIVLIGSHELTLKQREHNEKEEIDKAAHGLCSRFLALGNQWACKDCQTAERDRQRRRAAEAGEAPRRAEIKDIMEQLKASLEKSHERQRTDPAGWAAEQAEARAKRAKVEGQRAAEIEERAEEEEIEEAADKKDDILERLRASLAQKKEQRSAKNIRMRIVESGFRWLAKRCHPDVGGDTATMQKFVAARDELIMVIKADYKA